MDRHRRQITPRPPLPANQNGAPGKSTSHGFHQDQITLLNPAILQRDIQGKGYRSG